MTTSAPAAPAPAPTAPSPAPAAPSPSPAAAPAPAQSDSLFKPAAPAAAAASPAPGPAPAPADPMAWLPPKFRVMGADGKLDMEASSRKLGQGYTEAEKLIGKQGGAPDSPDAYQFTMPEAFKDVPLDPELSRSFRERAHKAGLTQQAYEFVMGEYFNLVPSLLDAKAAHTAEQARAELSKVWTSPTELEAGMNAAERAVSLAPEGMQKALRERYGTDPLFWQFAAHYGRQTREDVPPTGAAPAAPGQVEELMKSEAYNNSKHPQHAAVSEQVRQHFERRHGSAPVM